MLEESAEDLYENAPCGYVTTRLDGTVVRVNTTFEKWTGYRREDLLETRRLQDLFTPGGRIYHETHYAPLLQMQGSVREIAVELVRADGSLLPALINSVLRGDPSAPDRLIRTTIFDASDRRRYERELLQARNEEHEIALKLQRGLLSKSMPAIEGLELEVVHRPGRSGTEVGGDWFDAIRLDDDEVMLVVGDVVGHGIDAASDMGQLRSAVRAFAATGLGPGHLLEALDRYSERYETGQMATIVCAQINRRSGRMRHASAGHLPPLIQRPDEPPAFTWAGRSLPIATPEAGPQSRPEAETHIPPDGTVLFYTDGLVERRDCGLDPGMEQLRQELERHRDKSTAVLAGELIRALHDKSQVDDVCLLVARRGREVS